MIRRSITRRVTLLTLTLILLGAGLLVWAVLTLLEHRLRGQLIDQQLSVVALAAEELEQAVKFRLDALESIAGGIRPQEMADPRLLQSVLEQRPILPILFNAGVTITDASGIATATVPLSSGRVGTNYGDRAFMALVLQQGRSVVSEPLIGKKLKVPVIALAVPIRAPDGRVIGSLQGGINLSQTDNFIDRIVGHRYGQTGGYLLIARTPRLIITGTDKGRVMEALPAVGTHPHIDRFVRGDNGYAEFVTPKGLAIIAAVQQIPAANWYLALTLPAQEAFAVIGELRIQIVTGSLLLTLLVGLLIAYLLRREFAPLSSVVAQLEQSAHSGAQPVPLPVSRDDELGELLTAFNRLLCTVGEREQALQLSSQHARAIINAMPIPLAMNDDAGNITFLNQAFIASIGYTREEIPTLAEWWPHGYPDPAYRQWVADTWGQHLANASRSGRPFVPMELRIRCKDGQDRIYLVSAAPLADRFANEHLVILYDIHERKLMENELAAHRSRLQELVAERTAQLVEAKEAAETANRAKSTFLANMSHEFARRSPP